MVGLIEDISPRRALIVQPNALGDTICSLPLVRFLLAHDLADQVDMMARSPLLDLLNGRSELAGLLDIDGVSLHPLFVDHDDFDLPEGHPLIDLLRPYELVLCLMNDAAGNLERNLLHTAMMTHAADVISLEPKPAPDASDHAAIHLMRQVAEGMPLQDLPVSPLLLRQPLLRARESDQEKGRQALAIAGIDAAARVVVLHPGSGGRHKCWPAEGFIELAHRLQDEGCAVLWLLGPAEVERFDAALQAQLAEIAPVLDQLSLEAVARLLACAVGYVGNDSGISHLAGALRVPTVAIFAQSPCEDHPQPRHWQPLGPTVRVCQTPKNGPVWPEPQDVLEQVRVTLFGEF